MKYGIPSLMDYPDIEKWIGFCAESGYGFVEMNISYPWFMSDALDVNKLRYCLEKYNVGLTIHLHDQTNPFEFNTAMRQASLNDIMFAADLSRQLNASRITMHLIDGMYASIDGTKIFIYEHCRDKYLGLVDEFTELISRRIDSGKTKFCIENHKGWHSFQHEAIERMLQSPCFGLTYDIGHDYKVGNTDESFVMSHTDRLDHFHIHDVTAKANHMALGEGILDIPRYIRLAESLGSTVLCEVKESGALMKSREYLEKNGLW